MLKAGAAVQKETKYIAVFLGVLSAVMQLVFVLLKKWDYTVLLGNLLSLAIGVLNFYFMGVSVEKALGMDASDARKCMRASQGTRNFCIFAILAIGVLLPVFNTVATILPVFFPRIAVSFRLLFKEKEVIER